METKVSEEICIGGGLDTINNLKYNSPLHERIKRKHCSPNGCEIEITSVEHISSHGSTIKREFKEQHGS